MRSRPNGVQAITRHTADEAGPNPEQQRGGGWLRLAPRLTSLAQSVWLVGKYGAKTRRSWRKLHSGVDADTRQIVAAALTTKDVDAAAKVDPLLDQVASFTADGAYGQDGVSTAVAERHLEAAIIVLPRSTAVPREVAETAPMQRDRHLQSIAEHGRAAWQKASGNTKRSRAEAALGRFKHVIGDGLGSRADERRAAEVDVAVHALNRMLELGRPISVRIP